MGILIEGTKVFEDEQSIAYAFDWPRGERPGEVRITKAEVEGGLPTAGPDLEPAAAKILLKACKDARATGVWPDKVIYAS